jgi:hypothetical protein
MTDEEKNDFTTLKAQCSKIREYAFYAMRNISRFDDLMIKNTGHKTREDALVATYKYAQQLIDQLTNEFLEKYPD